MAIDREDIRHLEKLSRLELAPDEVETISEQVGRIVEFVQKLQSADTSKVEATKLIAHDDEEHLREDELVPGLPRETVLGQAPDADDEFFRVPRVIDREDGACS